MKIIEHPISFILQMFKLVFIQWEKQFLSHSSKSSLRMPFSLKKVITAAEKRKLKIQIFFSLRQNDQPNWINNLGLSAGKQAGFGQCRRFNFSFSSAPHKRTSLREHTPWPWPVSRRPMCGHGKQVKITLLVHPKEKDFKKEHPFSDHRWRAH